MQHDDFVARWFLSSDERGNPDTAIDDRHDRGEAWTHGNRATPLIHGAHYFRKLYEIICGLREDHWVHFTDWRGDADERLVGAGTEVGKVLADAAARGVHVRGLVWRSHPDRTRFSAEENLGLARIVNEQGGEVLLDERVRRGGSHHQKLFVLRRPGDERQDVAFVGGIDLCHSRNDDEGHLGDPQVYDLDERYGERPAWHDAQLMLEGPVVGDLAHTFRERWEDPTPLDHRNPWRKMMMRRAHEPGHPAPLPPMPDDPPPTGRHSVQVLRTYPAKRPAYPFARRGERSIARGYMKAVSRARRLVYFEDQYLWSEDVAAVLANQLKRAPDLIVIAVVPRYPEQDGHVTGPPNRLGQQEAVEELKRAGGDRVAIFNVENELGLPIYIHSKVCVIDDVWAAIGSDNLNRRSWTHDSELSCAVLDEELDEREPTDLAGTGEGARRFARDLRLQLWREHLERKTDKELVDPAQGLAAWRESATALEAWHRGGKAGARPRGRARVHEPAPVEGLARWLAQPVYRYLVDPDGRPRDLRKRNLY